ncbi:MAG: hypothetical protein NZ455_11600 [Bacteroidia bacterium]|nr:hypothetical protein [Bacteroidia bacterium]MDW8347763.1 hypothetical protein [Bacteroidia bacterium]
MGRSTVSPQHADLVGMSASETPTRTRPKNYKILHKNNVIEPELFSMQPNCHLLPELNINPSPAD